MNIFLDLAKRANFEISEVTLSSGHTYVQYKFDTRSISGDYFIASIYKGFANEDSARSELFEELKSRYSN